MAVQVPGEVDQNVDAICRDLLSECSRRVIEAVSMPSIGGRAKAGRGGIALPDVASSKQFRTRGGCEKQRSAR